MARPLKQQSLATHSNSEPGLGDMAVDDSSAPEQDAEQISQAAPPAQDDQSSVYVDSQSSPEQEVEAEPHAESSLPEEQISQARTAPAVEPEERIPQAKSVEPVHRGITGYVQARERAQETKDGQMASLNVSPEQKAATAAADNAWIVPALTRVMEDDEVRSFKGSSKSRPLKKGTVGGPRASVAPEQVAPQRGRQQTFPVEPPHAKAVPSPSSSSQHKLMDHPQLPEDPTAEPPADAAADAAPDAAADDAAADDAAAPAEEAPAEEAPAEEAPAEKKESTVDEEEDEGEEFEDDVRKAFDLNKIRYADIPLHYWAWWIAVLLVIGTIIISGQLILKHLENYEQPEVQKYVVRILFMAPLYAVDALLSLTFDGASPFLNVIRDCYEAFTLYSFTKMLYVWLGGEREVIKMMSLKKQIQLPFPLHTIEPWAMGDEMFYNCKLGVIQYVFVIPVLAVITFLTAAAGAYEGKEWYTMDLWISLASCMSATYAIYCLITFYISMQEELEKSVSNALAKFLCVKAVVFFCFWQGLVLHLILVIGYVPETEQFSSSHLMGAIQEWLICLEMFIISICFTLAYPVEEIIEMKTLNPRKSSEEGQYGTFPEVPNSNVV